MEYFWLVIIALSALGVYLYKKESIKLNQIFKRLATQNSGRVKHGVITYPTLTFPYQDQTIKVSAMPHEDGAYTYVSFSTNNYSQECLFKITSKSIFPKVLETDKNLQKQKVDIEEIETKFTVRAKNSDYVIALLTVEICESLLALDQKNTISRCDLLLLEMHSELIYILIKC